MKVDTLTRVTAKDIEKESDELLSFETDIDLEGKYCAERLIAYRDRISVHNRMTGKGRKIHLALIEGFRIESTLGSSFLQTRIRGKWVDILRQPGKTNQRLIDLTNKLTALISDERTPENNSDYLSRKDVGAPHSSGNEEQKAPPHSFARHTWRLFFLFRSFRGIMTLLLILSFGAVAIDLVPPMLQRLLVDRVLQIKLPNSSTDQMIFYLLAIVSGLLVVRVAAALLAIWKGIVSSRVGTMMTANLRNQLVEKLNGLPMAFHDRNQVGILMSQVSYDTESLHTLVYHMTSGFLLQAFQLLGIGAMIFYLNPKLALITMMPVPFIILGSWYFTVHLQPCHLHYWKAVGKQASALMGMLTGMRVVKAFVQEERETERFRDSSVRLRDSRMGIESSSAVFTALMGLFFALGTLAVWYIGGRDVMQGSMSLGSLMAFLAYLAMFYTPLTTIAESTTWFANFLSISRRISELLDAPSELENANEAIPIERSSGQVEFEKVSFGYDKSRPVLKQIDFLIEPGELVGVVGRSGSGKSTLVSLIARLYEADTGRILIDGMDVRKMNPRKLREKIGLVPQDPFLFRGSIAENIAYGNPAATPEQIIQAAKRADAHDFIMRLPFAYETQLGEGGMGISGGERQRISIARAVLCDPEILILDEATASVDVESERAICNALRNGIDKQTVIIIAHRLSTLKISDRLLVFENGRLLEQGSPSELLDRGGLYAAMVEIQESAEGKRGRRTAKCNAKELIRSNAGTDDLTGANNKDGLSALVDADKRSKYSFPDNGFGGGNDNRHHPRPHGICWLSPDEIAIDDNSRGDLQVKMHEKRISGVFAVPSFPSLHAGGYISLRCHKRSGREMEIGVIGKLEEWPTDVQNVLRRSLNRRYMHCVVKDIRKMRIRGNTLVISVSTDGGPIDFQLRNSSDCSQPFGSNGLLLIDESEKYYAIPDRRNLPKHQQRLLNLYFGD
jgi:ATP-binding cassette subfamily B protein